ncbi:MAG: lipid-A-disaccharide synthase [Proteobacteria bacterium]|nr:MAG: lipid-A-disaccharide synthase [Pseudomonadota bacterium]
MKIAMVAGEVSGDILGARLIEALKTYYPNAEFEGIAGAEMQVQGCRSLFDMDRLSVMGFSEVVGRLRELMGIRKDLLQRWCDNPPDVFIGIDAPDFNIWLEKRLHAQSIPSVHYVSPSIWAWRQGRVKKFVGNLDLMLALFPFEVDFYQQHKVPVAFVGHPLADEIPLENDKQVARQTLALQSEPFTLGVLPGSRAGEIQRIGPDFLKALKTLHQRHPDWQLVCPLVNDIIAAQFKALHHAIAPEVPIQWIAGQSRTVMKASDQLLMASGTAVLEGMLVGRPMVAAYRVAALTGWIIQRLGMIKSPFYTLPNNLSNEALVPELIQQELTPKAVIQAVETQFKQPVAEKNDCLQRFQEIHHTLRRGASQQAAAAIHQLLEKRA